VFDTETENAFNYLQIFTAIFNSFGHGANDVANAIGPLSTVYAIWSDGSVVFLESNKVSVQVWLLALGGAGIVFGLATYGYKIMSVIGVQLIKVTPIRGFCIELAAAFVITVGSFLGLPLSTTHCMIGATIGIGIAEKSFFESNVNWSLFGKIFLGWIFTLVVAGFLCAALFSFATFSPSQIYPISEGNCLVEYNQTICL
jgi:sodium-dependent phosphate transporter